LRRTQFTSQRARDHAGGGVPPNQTSSYDAPDKTNGAGAAARGRQ